jgi:perosamine synthetase
MVVLELAVEVLGLPTGSDIILPAFTNISVAQAITKAVSIPVVVDRELDTCCKDGEHVEKAITPKTKAIMRVHIYDHPVDMDPMEEGRLQLVRI